MFRLKEGQQEVGGVIADSFSLVRHAWAPNVIIILVGFLVSAAILALGGAMVKDEVMALIAAAKAAQAQHQVVSFASLLPGKNAQVVVAIAFSLVVWVSRITKAILVRSCWNVATTGAARLSNAFRVGLRYSFVYLFQVIAVLLAIAVMYVIQYYASKLNLAWANMAVAIVSQLLLYYVIVKLLLVDTSAVVDECGFRGFARSWRFTGRNWWRTVASLVLSVVFYAIFLVLIFEGVSTLVLAPGVSPMFANPQMMMQTLSPAWFAIANTVFSALTGLSILFTLPTMVASSHVVLYNDLKNRHRRDYL